MPSPLINFYKLFALLPALTLLFLPTLYASDIVDAASQLKAVFVPHFEKGFVQLTISNPSNRTLNVSPDIEYQVPPRHSQAGRIYVSLIFTQDPNAKIIYDRDDALSMILYGGPVPDPISIEPGETKLVIFRIAKFVSKIASASTDVKVILTCDKSTVKTILASKVDGGWKIKN